MSVAPGTRLSHYEIRSQIGAGGMGEVYLAQDTKLNRRVALKLLPFEVTTNKERLHRFEQEACAASSLNHPNIITIHEIGSENGTHFIATEFIDGVTLRQNLSSGSMRLSEVLDITIQVASALTAAHEAGIVHRDVKPENIMVRRDGYVKVVDFGLAKLAEQQIHRSDPEAATIVKTEPGMIMGTASYMSPEQARGLDVDARTDIWSLAVVMHEMLTGCLPFSGRTASDVIAAVLERETPPLVSEREEIPAELKRIISKALRKDREERYQTVKDLALDLKSLKQESEFDAKLERSTAAGGGQTVGTTGEHRKWAMLGAVGLLALLAALAYSYFNSSNKPAIDSIAVLPFVNASGDTNTEYLSDGITESLINRLSQLPKLRVVPRSTVFRYKGRDVDPQTVGRELGVQAVLTGKVVQRGDTLSIQIDLVDVAETSQLWGEQYNRKLADILSVQEEISREISGKLRIRLSGEEQKQLTKRYTENTEAYQLYLKGRYYWNKRTAENLKKGVDYFRQAIDIDPNYAVAYAGLADSYNVLPIWTSMETKDAYPKAKWAAQRALEIDETLAEAHTSLAYAAYRYDWNWPLAEREFKRAIELKPNYATAHQWYSFYLSTIGRLEESIVEIKRAQELEPLSLFISSDVGVAYYRARQFEPAKEQLRKTIEMDPTFAYAHYNLGAVYDQEGAYDKAVVELTRAVELSKDDLTAESPRDDLMVSSLAHAYAVYGRRIEAEKLLNELQAKSRRGYVSAYYFALIYSGLGEKDLAFEWLNKAYEERDFNIPRLTDEPRLDRLRSDSRFTELVRRVGLPQ